MTNLADLRKTYSQGSLSEEDIAQNPILQFQSWFEQASAAKCPEPHAMTLATISSNGLPSARIVLLKGITEDSFIFYTNYTSQKGRELTDHPKASICFPWNILSRQVRVVGTVEKVTEAESDEYFSTRPRGSQIGAWASQQSEVMADRSVLESRWTETDARFEGMDVPRPPHWGGFRVLPSEIEFWQGRQSRLHDRFRYTADGSQPTGWRVERLNP